MPAITYNKRTVESGTCTAKEMRTALSVAEREGVDAGARAADLPTRMVKFLCHEAGIKWQLNDQQDISQPIDSPQTNTAPDMDLKFIHPKSRTELFISIQKGGTGKFRLSSAAEEMLGVEVGDHICVAIDEQDDDLHFYVGCVHGNSDGSIRIGSYGSQTGFSAPGLAEQLNMTRVPSARRFKLAPEPIEPDGKKLYKATLQKAKEA